MEISFSASHAVVHTLQHTAAEVQARLTLEQQKAQGPRMLRSYKKENLLYVQGVVTKKMRSVTLILRLKKERKVKSST